jgi:hypothetical protein
MAQPSHPLSDFLSHVHLAPRQNYKSLTLWPLVRDAAVPAPATGPEYVALSTALTNNAVQIDEVSDHGEVPHVRVTNKGDVAVLFLFGEEIRGAKQNRVANASFLVPAKSETVIDVSCVEAGRWSRAQGERFNQAHDVISPTLRRTMAQQVRTSLDAHSGFRTDQGEVWEGISSRLRQSRTSSRTESYADYSERRAPEIDVMAKAFHPVEAQVGFIACIGDEIAGLEAIGRPEVFEVEFNALLRAYGIDAMDAAMLQQLEKRSVVGPRFTEPEPFLAELRQAPCRFGPSLGLGNDLRFENARVAGCALTCEGLVHATAFPA